MCTCTAIAERQKRCRYRPETAWTRKTAMLESACPPVHNLRRGRRASRIPAWHRKSWECGLHATKRTPSTGREFFNLETEPQPMTATAVPLGTAAEWIPCLCCARHYPATSMVAFEHHPADHVCTECIHWLHSQARPASRIIRHHVARLSIVRAWRARFVPLAAWHGSGQPRA